MKEISLSRGKFAIVDDEDYKKLSVFKWHVLNSGRRFYAARHANDGTKRYLLMHREILQTSSGLVSDHINGDGLDNRRCNLRVATFSQNSANRGKQRDNSSGFKGVYFYKNDNRWFAQIKVNQKAISLGRFASREEAHNAYAEAARKYYGEFANIGS